VEGPRRTAVALTVTAALVLFAGCSPDDLVDVFSGALGEEQAAGDHGDGTATTSPSSEARSDERPRFEPPPEETIDEPGPPPAAEQPSNDDEDGTEAEPPQAPTLATDDPARISAISEGFRSLMEETTWEPGCPVGIDELRQLTVRHVDLDDAEQEGELIVHADVAEDLLDVFARLYEQRFPIERIEPIEHFDGDDDASMAANNTSAFNCRPITGSDRWSEHAYGRAVDINPVQNPYVRDGEVLPPEGEPYVDRSDERPGMLTRPGPVEPFDEIGWGWGGDWSSLKDYMHLSLTGR
jgi:hypothetical protein